MGKLFAPYVDPSIAAYIPHAERSPFSEHEWSTSDEAFPVAALKYRGLAFPLKGFALISADGKASKERIPGALMQLIAEIVKPKLICYANDRCDVHSIVVKAPERPSAENRGVLDGENSLGIFGVKVHVANPSDHLDIATSEVYPEAVTHRNWRGCEGVVSSPRPTAVGAIHKSELSKPHLFLRCQSVSGPTRPSETID
jgi:hypothetical protein